jgi:hypothetical protein
LRPILTACRPRERRGIVSRIADRDLAARMLALEIFCRLQRDLPLVAVGTGFAVYEDLEAGAARVSGHLSPSIPSGMMPRGGGPRREQRQLEPQGRDVDVAGLRAEARPRLARPRKPTEALSGRRVPWRPNYFGEQE